MPRSRRSFLSMLCTLCLVSSLVLLFGCPSKSQPVRKTPLTKGGMTLQLSQKSVILGQKTEISLKNEGSKTYTYNFPGANNGCALPIYRMMLKYQDGSTYIDRYVGPDRNCTRQKIPPRTVEIEAGQAYKLTLDTGKVWYIPPKGLSGRAKRTSLPTGRYQVMVTGGGLSLMVSGLTIQSAP